MPLVQYTKCQPGFMILCHYFPAIVRCLRDSRSVTDSGSHSGTPFEAHFADFCVTNFKQNFLRRHLKENGMLKILAACRSGPLPAGALHSTHVRTVLNG